MSRREPIRHLRSSSRGHYTACGKLIGHKKGGISVRNVLSRGQYLDAPHRWGQLVCVECADELSLPRPPADHELTQASLW